MATQYELALGNVETHKLSVTASLKLWQEHGMYHVRVHCREQGRLAWETAVRLTDARQLVAKLKKQFTAKGA